MPTVPPGYHVITPYLVVPDAVRAIAFYTAAFGATELYRLQEPGGAIGHAELVVGDSHLLLADEHLDAGFLGPDAIGGTPVSLLLYVDDVDAVFDRAIALGARLLRAVQDQFYGDRAGTLQDPFGHVWTIATHKETLAADELQRRFAALGRAE